VENPPGKGQQWREGKGKGKGEEKGRGRDRARYGELAPVSPEEDQCLYTYMPLLTQ